MTRLWLQGDPIIVGKADAWTPAAFHWRGSDHAVDTIITQWRIDRLWWTMRIWRDYFELTTHSGLMVVIYHDLIADTWYLQRLYD